MSDSIAFAQAPASSLGQRLVVFAYGLTSYLLFFSVFGLGFPLFVWDAPIPLQLSGAAASPIIEALAVDLGLIAAFGVQHSVMARKSFKRWLTRVVPGAAERATFVLVSTAMVIALMLFWRPMPTSLYSVSSEFGFWALNGVSAVGFALILASSFALNHFDLFGLRQVWMHLSGETPSPVPFRQPWLYRICRHPLMLGFLIFLWATPEMTVGRLVLNLGLSAYIFVGLWYEERDLIADFGERYLAYKARVPKVLPKLW